jgi:hypothetical protein
VADGKLDMADEQNSIKMQRRYCTLLTHFCRQNRGAGKKSGKFATKPYPTRLIKRRFGYDFAFE